MATIALQMAGTAFGSFLGGPFGAAIGSAVGGIAGAMVDRALFGGGRIAEGPRLSAFAGISASEGQPIPRIYGRVRLGGQVIWATEFEEERHIERTGGGGGKGGAQPKQKVARYSYFANAAIGLCEGPVSFIRRIWADGEELDLANVTMRFHDGSENQPADPLIIAKQGTADVPAFRGLAYVVFERLPLEKYGNRLPQLSFEVVRAMPGLPEKLRAINIIPGSTEFGYSGVETRETFGLGGSQPINRAQWTHATDWEASIEQLVALAPNLERATLISAWFGDDLRAGQCTLRPKVEKLGKVTAGGQWSVAGLTRASAQEVSRTADRPNFGGSPSDQSLIDALRDLKARGLKVALHPFVLMDIAPGNALPDPWSGAAGQPAFPWRGRITPSPAPGQPGSPDGTPAIAAQIAAFVGTANAGHFARTGDTILYSGPAEWSFRRMVLHHAMIAQAAGGVDTFIIASELIGLTHAYAGGGNFPFVGAMAALLAELRAILGPATIITYAADWTEYGAHVRQSGNEVRFPLDPLWAHGEIGAIGIDFYPPLTDWRAGRDHLDAAEAHGPADPAFLRARLGAGEGHDWYYPGPAAREAQNRVAITDGVAGKPWVFRQKDILNWWRNPHVERVGGVELAGPTAYLPMRKPIYLTEIGCPAVDKGGNQPNVFPDPKSIENALPHFSTGARNDLIQRRVLEAVIGRFDPADAAFSGPDNPLSPHYAGRMVDAGFIAPWAWDARPFPAFPRLGELWSDGENWFRGHWLNGRLEGAPLDGLLPCLHADFGLASPACLALDEMVDGYVIDRPMSARAAIEPVARLFSLGARPDGDGVAFFALPAAAPVVLSEDDLVPARDGTLISVTRYQESELPRAFGINFVDSDAEFQKRALVAETRGTQTRREQILDIPLHMPMGLARRLAETRLQEIWAGRERFSFRLRPARRALEPGDVVQLPTRSGARMVRLTRITDGIFRDCEGVAFEPLVADAVPVSEGPPAPAALPALPGAAYARLLELPVERGDGLLHAAIRADPWRGPYSVSAIENANARLVASADASAGIGVTLSPLPPGALWRWDHHARLDVRIEGRALTSLDETSVLAGGNAVALIDASGVSELVLFRSATLIGDRQYRLQGLLRGTSGSESAAARSLAAGAEVVVLDEAIAPLEGGFETIGRAETYLILPAGRPIGDPVGVSLAASPSGLALKPLAPVHPRARRQGGDVAIEFIRRARNGGDSWDLFEVPLGEEREEYRLEILAGTNVKRSLTLGEPRFLYPSAWEIADFGGAQSSLSVRIRQVSAQVGPGHALETVIPVL
ncbi:MAG: glycoside hydrolase/phage tail family protein [Proteobacteria bacterium]|nr:glycoside hydrolase/phage tail family protein [Pseudomonadota bacterium]